MRQAGGDGLQNIDPVLQLGKLLEERLPACSKVLGLYRVWGRGRGRGRGVQGMEAGSGVRPVVSAQCEGQLQGAGVPYAWNVVGLIKNCASA